jgi:hypothetical protein
MSVTARSGFLLTVHKHTLLLQRGVIGAWPLPALTTQRQQRCQKATHSSSSEKEKNRQSRPGKEGGREERGGGEFTEEAVESEHSAYRDIGGSVSRCEGGNGWMDGGMDGHRSDSKIQCV